MPEELFAVDVFPWVSEPSGVGQISLSRIIQKHHVPRSEIKTFLLLELERTEQLCTMPFTLLFIIVFAGLVSSHEPVLYSRAVEGSVANFVMNVSQWADDNEWIGFKVMDDVNSYTEFFSWARVAFLPAVFTNTTGVNRLSFRDRKKHNIATKAPDTLLNYNKIIGGVRFRQERSGNQSCDATQKMMAFYGQNCYSDEYTLNPDRTIGRFTDAATTVWMLVEDTDDVRFHQLTELELNNWLDLETQKLEITVPLYNAEFDLYSYITFNFYFSPGGRIWKQTHALSVRSMWYTDVWSVWWDVCFILCLLRKMCSEGFKIYIASRHQKVWTEYVTSWTVIDWSTVICGFGLLGQGLFSFISVSNVNGSAEHLPSLDTNSTEFKNALVDFVDQLESCVNYFHYLSLSFSLYPFLLLILMFKSFSAQPRLAIINRTLRRSAVDLFHLIIVLMCMITTSAFVGHLLFGRRIEDFATFTRSLNTAARSVMGDFDFREMRKVGDVEAFLWLLGTTISLNLLLLNMMLALIAESFNSSKFAMESAITLLQSIYDICWHWFCVLRGSHVRFHHALKVLEYMEQERQERVINVIMRQHPGTMSVAMKAADAPLVGADTQACKGMRVVPSDCELRRFLGAGYIKSIEKNGTCIVVHDSGHVVQHDIGAHSSFALELCDEEQIVVPSPHGQKFVEFGLVSVSRLCYMMRLNKLRMSTSQANFILKGAVRNYYYRNKDTWDVDQVRRKFHQARFRGRFLSAAQCWEQELAQQAHESSLIRMQLSEFHEATRAKLMDIREKSASVKASSHFLRARFAELNSQNIDRILDDIPAPDASSNIGSDDARSIKSETPVVLSGADEDSCATRPWLSEPVRAASDAMDADGKNVDVTCPQPPSCTIAFSKLHEERPRAKWNTLTREPDLKSELRARDRSPLHNEHPPHRWEVDAKREPREKVRRLKSPSRDISGGRTPRSLSPGRHRVKVGVQVNPAQEKQT